MDGGIVRVILDARYLQCNWQPGFFFSLKEAHRDAEDLNVCTLTRVLLIFLYPKKFILLILATHGPQNVVM